MVTTFGCRTRASNRPSSMIDAPSWLDDDGSAGEQLERDLAIETRVPRAVDVAECSSSDWFQQAQRSPGLGLATVMRPCNRRDRFQTAHDGPVLRRSVRIGGLPVDWRAIEDRARQLGQRGIVVTVHAPSRGRGERAPAGPPCARHRRLASPTQAQARRRSSLALRAR